MSAASFIVRIEGGGVKGNREKEKKLACALYQDGIPQADIAKKLKIPAGTIRRWKHTYKWDETCSANENEHGTNRQQNARRGQVLTEDELAEDGGLNDKQKLFCLHYTRCFNATKAYQKAYKCSYESAAANASRLLKDDRIREEIKRLKQNRFNRELISEEDLFQKYIDIALADMADFVEFGKKLVPAYLKNGTKIMIEDNYIDFKDSDKIDGTIVKEVKKGKLGISVKLEDRMKALQWLTDHIGLASEEQRLKIEHLKKQTEKIKEETKSITKKREDEW